MNHSVACVIVTYNRMMLLHRRFAETISGYFSYFCG